MLLLIKSRASALMLVLALVLIFPYSGHAQSAPAASPKVSKIDIKGLEMLLKPSGKPLLINFWATWCDPCREEFPDLVNIDKAYRGKIDFVTVSLDDLADINGEVPKFLLEMKAEMPAYLLSTPDESAAIKLVSKDWAGSLPLTILFDEKGSIAYQKNGKVRAINLATEIDKALVKPAAVK
jgi:thiol-disulfide isomerase/thioredoxin